MSETNIWLFQYATHAACSSVSFDCFGSVLTPTPPMNDHSICEEQDGSHMKLLPDLYDNMTFQGIYSIKVTKGSLSEQDATVIRPLLDWLNGLLKGPPPNLLMCLTSFQQVGPHLTKTGSFITRMYGHRGSLAASNCSFQIVSVCK